MSWSWCFRCIHLMRYSLWNGSYVCTHTHTHTHRHTCTHTHIYIYTGLWSIKYLEQLMYVPIVGTVVRVPYIQWEHTQAVPNIWMTTILYIYKIHFTRSTSSNLHTCSINFKTSNNLNTILTYFIHYNLHFVQILMCTPWGWPTKVRNMSQF